MLDGHRARGRRGRPTTGSDGGVDLSHPDIELHVDAYARELYVSVDRLRAAGGLPVGTSGRALVLLSGGIDSPVAAYRMMKRGLRCDFVHFSGQPLTGPESAYKAYALVARLNRFQGRSRLFVVPFGIAQRLLASAGAGRLQVLAGRRLMVRVADALARREQCEALITGDSLGQVASQTLRNLEVVEGASTLPLLRPLIDRDKSEIIDEAQRLGTFETSILPDEDCCTLLMPGRAVTWTDPEPLIELERRVDVETVVEQLVERALVLWPRLDAARHAGRRRAGRCVVRSGGDRTRLRGQPLVEQTAFGTASIRRCGSGTRAAVSASSARPSAGILASPWASDAITARGAVLSSHSAVARTISPYSPATDHALICTTLPADSSCSSVSHPASDHRSARSG